MKVFQSSLVALWVLLRACEGVGVDMGVGVGVWVSGCPLRCYVNVHRLMKKINIDLVPKENERAIQTSLLRVASVFISVILSQDVDRDLKVQKIW